MLVYYSASNHKKTTSFHQDRRTFIAIFHNICWQISSFSIIFLYFYNCRHIFFWIGQTGYFFSRFEFFYLIVYDCSHISFGGFATILTYRLWASHQPPRTRCHWQGSFGSPAPLASSSLRSLSWKCRVLGEKK